MGVKKRFKLFKAGKKWCTMAIVAVAMVAGGVVTTTTASADTKAGKEIPTQVAPQPSQSQPTPVAGKQPNQLGDQGAQAKQVPANPQPTNQPVGKQVDYQTPVNAGYLDGAQETVKGQVEFSGWHATNQYQVGMHHFVIVTNGKGGELYRGQVTAVDRPDVARAYPKSPIAEKGGFKLDVPAEKLAGADSIQLVSRYTKDPNGNPLGGADYWFPVITTKAGYLDQFQVLNNQVVVAGWHVDDQAAIKTDHTVILYDITKGREVGRAEHGTNLASADLLNAGYRDVANAGKARFRVTFSITPAMMGDQLAVISRYNLPKQENTNYSDIWFNNRLTIHNNGNAGYLDQFALNKQAQKITVSGWHADDQSVANPEHLLILIDQTTNKEVARQLVSVTDSPDVAHAYGNIYNAGKSRFTASFAVDPAMLNHQFVVISRYTQKGQENSHYFDYRFNQKVLNLATAKQGWLDQFSINRAAGKVTVAGWSADDASVVMPTHFVILYDQTANQEVGRQIVKDQPSADVARSGLGGLVNAPNCRFSTSFAISPDMVGHKLVVVSRYSDSKDLANYGHYSDYWFNNHTVTFNVNQKAWLDHFDLNAGQKKITVSGWHASDATGYLPEHFVILFDKTAGREMAHKVVPTTASPDVAGAIGHLGNAAQSRFAVTFDLTPATQNHVLTVISRYTNSRNANYGSNYSDYWFNNQIDLNAQDGYLDNLSESGNTITASGWHTVDSTVGLSHHVILLWDYSQNREIARHEVTDTSSGDLLASHRNFVNANQARFQTSFTVDPRIAHNCFGIISRYSNQANGEGTYTQWWMNNRYLNAYQNPGWMYQIQYKQITANPAEVGHTIGPGYEGVKTMFIKNKLGDANIHNQYTVGDGYAIMNIQRSHGLPATGWVDLPTWRALGYSDDLWYGIDSYVSPTLTNPGATRQQRINAMINTAAQYMGKPWWAGCSSAPAWGVDCSGLVMQALYGAGINPTSVSSTHHGYPGNEWNSRNLFTDPHFMNVSWNNRQRGDLVFYYEPGTQTIIHVAILVDPNNVIESWPPQVMIQPIVNGQRSVIAGIRRVFA